MKKSDHKSIVPGGVDEYIANCPPEAGAKLTEIRNAIKSVAPGSIETVSYFQIPGYSYEGYSYNGMFVWFSYQKSKIRLHFIPPVIDKYKDELSGYKTTKSIVSFDADVDLPISLVKKLVKASIEEMKS
jgi:uncharacterized protein YdhG (YjbR/CyaY superfamily)